MSTRSPARTPDRILARWRAVPSAAFRALLAGLLLAALGPLAGSPLPTAIAGDDPAAEEPPPPWELTRREEGEPYWAPLMRMREAEARYRDTKWWGGYAQMRAHVEAGIGNHAAALQAWDAWITPRDSVGVLPRGVRAQDALEYLSAVADTARVIMVNERHHAASDRLLTLELLPLLWEKGYRYFAAEAFDPADTELGTRGYPVEESGVYLQDPVFAATVREAIRLGYTLVAYESTDEDAPSGEEQGVEELTPQQRRDRGQAANLARATVERDPGARVLVHAGYSHVLEEASERWYPMALYFRERTGIDPVTVDQTRLSERSDPSYEDPSYRACAEAGWLEEGPVVLVDAGGEPYGPAEFAVDIQVLTPRSSYTNGRPDWMTLGTRRGAVRIDVPEGGEQWCLVEGRSTSEPPEAIALDRAELRDSREAWLFLPEGREIVVRILGIDGTVLREQALEQALEAR